MILVTGSNGMIGTALCQTLLEGNRTFIGVDRQSNPWDETVDAKTIKSDLLEPGWQNQLPQKIETIVHLAASSRVNTAVEDPDEYINNINSLFSVLEFARQRNVKKVIFSSSKEVYGFNPNKKMKEELIDLSKSENPYSASKIAGEALLYSYFHCYGINSVVLRFSNVYGKYDLSSRVIPLFIKRALSNKSLIVYGKEKKLDFVYLDDVVRAVTTTIDSFDQVKNTGYNIAYGRSFSLVRIAEQINNYLGKELDIRIEENRVGEIMQYQANIDKSQKKLGFSAQTPLAEGLAQTIAWHQTLDEKIATL